MRLLLENDAGDVMPIDPTHHLFELDGPRDQLYAITVADVLELTVDWTLTDEDNG